MGAKLISMVIQKAASSSRDFQKKSRNAMQCNCDKMLHTSLLVSSSNVNTFVTKRSMRDRSSGHGFWCMFVKSYAAMQQCSHQDYMINMEQISIPFT